MIFGLIACALSTQAAIAAPVVMEKLTIKTIDTFERKENNTYVSHGRLPVERSWEGAPIRDFDEKYGFVALPFTGQGLLWVRRSDVRIGCPEGHVRQATSQAPTNAHNGNGIGTLNVC